MADEPLGISRAEAAQLLRALGATPLFEEACAAAAGLAAAGRAAFLAGVEAASRAGESGHHAIWAGLNAAAGSANRVSIRGKEGAREAPPGCV